ncbi:uncharacterized protein LOC125501116 isoform X1 [Athalia rosae]|uniref:uncharacterized protein LOC125501116 isoform X1 n=1 Tax=Athalia rosae TaxID=37344 RepID=UPI00203444B7|nr:uncharacterized protein LOC125501116 isoform X1 [Athalia rosae]
MLPISNLVFAVLAVGMVTDMAVVANIHRRFRRQSEGDNGEIIDNIFNIPITAIRQTAAAAQSIYPEGSSSIDSVFNIPVATLEAVGSLVKNRNALAQRRPMDSMLSDYQKRRKERKDRLHAKRQGQRLQQNDPFGVNALTDLLVGDRGFFSGHGSWGGHLHDSLSEHLSNKFQFGSQLVSHFAGHGSAHGGSHGDGDQGNDDHDDVGENVASASSSSISDNDGYEVTEEPEDRRKGWGSWFDFGNIFGGQSSSSANRERNKVAPRPDRRKYGRYEDQDAPLENKIAPKNSRTDHRRNYAYDQRPLENKIAPKDDRRYYQRKYNSDPRIQDRAAPRQRQARDRFVFEHRSL